MSRRMDREGMHRMEPQGIKNRRFTEHPRCVENPRGWIEPFANWQGWEELNKATYTYRRVMILRAHMSPYERADSIRSIRYEIAASQRCERPRLP